MTDSYQLPQQDRPDPAVLLIDAVINRQSDLAQRLSQQLVHRQGVHALERFIETRLQTTCGADGATWLRQQLNAAAAEAEIQQAPREALGQAIKSALQEAMAPLRQEQPPAPLPPVTALRTSAAPVAAVEDPWALSPLKANEPPLKAERAVRPAPLPTDLAELRAWLHSDAA